MTQQNIEVLRAQKRRLFEECVEDILGERQHVPDFKIYVIDQIGRERIETSATVSA